MVTGYAEFREYLPGTILYQKGERYRYLMLHDAENYLSIWNCQNVPSYWNQEAHWCVPMSNKAVLQIASRT